MCEILTAIGFKFAVLWDVTTRNWEDGPSSEFHCFIFNALMLRKCH